MPFPWKKNRVPRISQIVADLQSPKHGGSLVVETGFPTSLIDLFVKNKGRFRKPKNKKRVQVGISNPVTEAPAAPAPPPTPEASSLGDGTVRVEGPILKRRVGEDADVDHGVSVSVQDCDLGRESDCGSDSNTVLAAVLKIFVVVVFSLCMKLTASVTLSAFVLLFIEFVGKRVFCCLKPCSDANRNFKSLAKRVRHLLLFKQRKGSYSAEASAPPIVDEEHLVHGVELGYSPTCTQEIEIVESKSDNEKEIPIPCEESHRAELDFNSSEHSKIAEKECDECKGKHKRSSKLKSKFVKKLVPKKLRKSNTEKKSKQREGESSFSSTAEESVKSRRSEIEVQQNDNEREVQENGNRSFSWLPRQLECMQDDEVDNGIACSNQSPLQKRDDHVAVSNAEKRVDRVEDSGYIILLLIALAGLVVGRFPAMLLTMAWIFLLKIVKSGGISLKLPLVRCSVPISWKKKNI
ncbi:hypothetical protein L6164_037028 [Bauhinia variegata]|uniref:Uncharacterized protein n=1 Tax=Bauhinia variegata TaxID=167791 RepID=A0ACB9KJ06_BAUVA|nr:hypothetical protein L6164_037028 [Bauhinia variegata]